MEEDVTVGAEHRPALGTLVASLFLEHTEQLVTSLTTGGGHGALRVAGHGEEVVIAAGQVWGADQGEAAAPALHWQLTILGPALGTEVTCGQGELEGGRNWLWHKIKVSEKG